MFILITALFLFLTALAMVVLRIFRPGFRFGWLIAAGSIFLTWLSVILWQSFMPLTLDLPAWQPSYLFRSTPSFFADQLSWPYALSLATLALALILTAVVREDFPDQLGWAGFLTLTGLGMLAVLADNPLTLALVWGAIDLAELVSQLRSAEGESANERVVTRFAARILGTGILLWAGLSSLAKGIPLGFHETRHEAGVLLILASALRLGVIPLHTVHTSELSLRRGYGTIVRLVSAASSLILLARIPVENEQTPFAPLLLALATIAGFYSALLWARSTDALAGRPYWVMGMSSLAVAAALRGAPTGTVAWGVSLILVGGALFLSSLQHRILRIALLAIGIWGVSALPFSPTAASWLGSAPNAWIGWLTWPFLLGAQALLIAGFIRHTLRPAVSTPFESLPIWSRNVYPFGVGILLFTLVLLSVYGWDGALQVGTPVAGVVALVLTGFLYWLTPRLPWLNPIGTRPLRAGEEATLLDSFYNVLWNIYTQTGRLVRSFHDALEGDGGILWALLFLVLFLTLFTPGLPK